MKLASKNDTFIKALKHKAAWEPFYSYLLPLLCYVILIFDFLADFDFTQRRVLYLKEIVTKFLKVFLSLCQAIKLWS